MFQSNSKTQFLNWKISKFTLYARDARCQKIDVYRDVFTLMKLDWEIYEKVVQAAAQM